ncbi:hypothetical protein B6D29_00545 [Microgenomates bacterium UTCPR1]|nr:MAG: hypothetical protein B6D29_00545 [Microgenomates bacterium UTCPR1]
MMMVRIGAHQSIAGGYEQSLKRIANIGGNCLQIFSSSPKGWSFSVPNKSSIDIFVKEKNKLNIDPIYFHATYLINLADGGRIGNLSKQSLISEMNLSPKLGIRGSIIHLGSFKTVKAPLFQDHNMKDKYKVLIKNIKEVLIKTPKESLFIIENAGNRKIGQTLEELSLIFESIDDERARLCLDTCHLFSNGYKFKNDNELNDFINKLKKLKLLEKLEVWHLNDSRDPFDSGRDRHANIGEGTVPFSEFKTLINHPLTKKYPFILEVPGFDGKGPDKENIDILKSCVNPV